jgi:hypothetical protein
VEALKVDLTHLNHRDVDLLYRLSIESQMPSTLTAIAFMINYSVTNTTDLTTVVWELIHPFVYVVAMLGKSVLPSLIIAVLTASQLS